VSPVGFFPYFGFRKVNMEKIMIYMSRVSARGEYIFSLLLRDLMGAELVVTDHLKDYFSYQGPCLEYSTEPSGHGIFIHSCGLLVEKSLEPQTIGLFTYKECPAFFAIADDRSAFPFDLFAAAFYLVTRYEEYLPFIPDRFGRFRASDSIATAGKFLNIPVVNIWTEMLKHHIKSVYPAMKFHEKNFRYTPTIDIDHAYAYIQRTFLRTLGGYGRSLMLGDLNKIIQRTNVLLGKSRDPYDQYDYIREVHARFGWKPFYFILFAQHGKDDNNVTLSGKIFRQLLHDLDASGTVGIHPSLTSGKQAEVLQSEIDRLSKIIGHKIVNSRQHFLKVSFPGTCRELIKQGITDDYSLGYASNPGFRAGIADPFPFFDLVSNRSEQLIIHPVALMDVTLKDYLKTSPDEAIVLCRSFADTIKNVNGEFVSIWHNESFDESGRWKGWRKVYEDILSYTSDMMKNK
jgi:hypothetical protein